MPVSHRAHRMDGSFPSPLQTVRLQLVVSLMSLPILAMSAFLVFSPSYLRGRREGKGWEGGVKERAGDPNFPQYQYKSNLDQHLIHQKIIFHYRQREGPSFLPSPFPPPSLPLSHIWDLCLIEIIQGGEKVDL